MENFRSHLGCTRVQQQSILLWEISLNFFLPTGYCWTSAAYNSPVVIHVHHFFFFCPDAFNIEALHLTAVCKVQSPFSCKRSDFLPEPASFENVLKRKETRF